MSVISARPLSQQSIGEVLQIGTMLPFDAVRQRLIDWGLVPPVDLVPVQGGINSQVWFVVAQGRKYVAKMAHPSQLLPGLEVATYLEQRGFPAGSPIPTRAGDLAVMMSPETALALLRFIPGRPLDVSNEEDLARIGHALGKAHALLVQMDPPRALSRWPWHWVTDWTGSSPASNLREAVERAVKDAEDLVAERRLTLGVIHGDVSVSDFKFDPPTGDVALVDWGATTFGPLLYDLGSLYALRLRDDEPRRIFTSAYLSTGPLPADELQALDAFTRLRWAVQARYFSWRIANDVRTGREDDRHDREGLLDALRALGLPGEI